MWAAKRKVFDTAELASSGACPVTAGEYTSGCCRIALVNERQTMSRHCSSGARNFGQPRFGLLLARGPALRLVRTLDQH